MGSRAIVENIFAWARRSAYRALPAGELEQNVAVAVVVEREGEERGLQPEHRVGPLKAMRRRQPAASAARIVLGPQAGPELAGLPEPALRPREVLADVALNRTNFMGGLEAQAIVPVGHLPVDEGRSERW